MSHWTIHLIDSFKTLDSVNFALTCLELFPLAERKYTDPFLILCLNCKWLVVWMCKCIKARMSHLPAKVAEADIEFMFLTGLASAGGMILVWNKWDNHCSKTNHLICSFKHNLHLKSLIVAHQICRVCLGVAGRTWVFSCVDCCVSEHEVGGKGLDWLWRTSPWKAV